MILAAQRWEFAVLCYFKLNIFVFLMTGQAEQVESVP